MGQFSVENSDLPGSDLNGNQQRHVYDDSTLNNYEIVPEVSQLTPEDWDDYYDTVVRPHVQEARPRGQYAAAARKRRAAEPSDGG